MHFPLSTFLLFPFYLISNWYLKLEPLFSLILALATLALIFRISIRLLSQKATILSLAFFTLLFYYFTTSIQYSMEAVVGLLLTIIIYKIVLTLNSKKISPFGIFLDGLLIGITELTGQIATLSLIVIFLFHIYQIHKRAHNKKDYIRSLSFYLSGILLPIAVLSTYFIKNNAFTDFFYLNVTYYFNYLHLAKENNQSRNFPWGQITIFYAPLVAALFAIITKFKLQSKNTIYILITFVTISSIPSIVFSIFHPHHFLYILPTTAILTGLAFDVLSKNRSSLGRLLTLFLLLIIVINILSVVLPWYWEQSGRNKRNSIVNDVLPGTDMDSAVKWVLLNTEKSDKILVAGDNLFYVRADRLPSAKRQLVAPWHYKPMESTIPIIVNNRPDYWIIDSDYIKRLKSPEGWNSPEITDFLDSELRECYQKLIEFSTWQIWRFSCVNK